MDEWLYTVRVTEIGEFIHHKLCERRFKLGFNNRAEARRVPFAARLFNPIDPVLQATGKIKEDQLARELTEAGLIHITDQQYHPENLPRPQYPTWDNFLGALATIEAGQDGFAREVQVQGNIGRFSVDGRIDFILFLWRGGRPILRIVEAKSSRKDRTYHRIQVALYRMIVRQILHENPVTLHEQQIDPSEIECSVVRIDEQNRMQSILNTPTLDDLSQEETDIDRLLSNEGPLVRIINTPLNELDYKLEVKCDDCVFDVHCLPESSLHRRLELLSIEPSDVRVLRGNGVQTIDDLVELDIVSHQARNIQIHPAFTQNLRILQTRARTRRTTLPGGRANPDEYQVEPIPYQGYGQLPDHIINGEPLIRIFLAVDYDYVEDRLVSLSAHVTSSMNEIETRVFRDGNGELHFDPVVYEVDSTGHRTPLADESIIHFITTEWRGEYTFDSGREGELIHRFFHELVEKIADVANGRNSAPIHFYVWSREEITHLIEACSRVDTRLLSHLNELFGCREPLDQLIFSCLRDEITQRYALGWTGKGLSVVTSLFWFGRKYHWTRTIGGQSVWLEQAFTQDIFDFKTRLNYRDDQTWVPDGHSTELGVRTHTFELRSRFNDGLTVPYWHAIWRTLPDPNDLTLTDRTRGAITRYNRARTPGYVTAFLKARVHALRWLEEQVRQKNHDIAKQSIVIADLPTFTLNVTSTARAAIDFLRLENHIKRTDWVAKHLVPPGSRVSSGETIPVSGITRIGTDRIVAHINLTGYDVDLNSIQVSSVFGEGSYVRLTPCSQDPNQGQRLYQLVNSGWTCVIERIDWVAEEIELSLIPSRNESRYVLPSHTFGDNVFDYATIDSSITDFVAKRVDEHLSNMQHSPIYDWFDPERPRIPGQTPVSNDDVQAYRRVLSDFLVGETGNWHLESSQIDIILDGLNTRIQLLQGPPGTGKTVTTAIATLLRVLARRRNGEIVLVSANTHTALDNLLNRIHEFSTRLEQLCEEQNLHMPSVTIAKVHSNDPEDASVVVENIRNFNAGTSRSNVRDLTNGHVAIIGGTTSALLKMHRELVGGRQFREGFCVSSLIVDEASMMVFPHFLALATLVAPQGEIMLTGDHRQLAPIVSHDWENEDRPPIVVYQPYKSAYEAVRDIARRNIPSECVRISALRFTFRLPPPLVDLISRLYRLDDIDLQGLPRETEIVDASHDGGSWNRIWQVNFGLFLVLHSERQSQRCNQLEAEIIRQIVEAGMPQPNDSIAVVTPHRAQRSLLKTRLEQFYGGPIGIIDTVERLQGDQRPTVILSATESDTSYISSNVGFILDLNRSNVAFSRSQDRLIVVCSEALINHIPVDYDQYESTMLWKALRNVCSRLIANIDVQGTTVRIFTFEPPPRVRP
jgi:hypothetical protein